MKKHFNGALQAFRRGLAWLIDRQDLVNSTPSMPALVARLDKAIERLNTASIDQERLRAESLEQTLLSQRLGRDLWLYHMGPIAAIARTVVPGDQELAAAVRLPHANRNVERTLTTAEAIGLAVCQRQQMFVESGLAPDFHDRLLKAIHLFRQSIDEGGRIRARRTGATNAVSEAVSEGKTVLRLIDNSLKATLRDANTLREWESAKRIAVRGPASDETTTQPDAGRAA
jgi:hypothetical protein